MRHSPLYARLYSGEPLTNPAFANAQAIGDLALTQPPDIGQDADGPIDGPKCSDKSIKLIVTISIDLLACSILQTVQGLGALLERSSLLKARSARSSESSPDSVCNSLVNCLVLTVTLEPVDEGIVSKVLAVFRKSFSSC